MSKNKKIITSLVAIVMVLSTLLAIAIPASAAAPTDGYVENVTTGKYVTIKNVGSGKLLNVYGNQNKNNANVTVYQADGSTGQSFQFVKSGNSYVIVPKCATSRALNVYGSSAKNNSNVCLWSKTGHSTQAWIIDYNPSLNGFVIRSANNQNYVLAATGSKNSSNVCLKKYNPNDKYQVWTSSALKVNAVDSSVQDTSKITTAEIQAVLDKYNYADGRYWTVKETAGGKSDTCSNYSKGISADLYSSGTKATTSNYYKSYNYQSQWQCHGFASYVMGKVTNTEVRPTYGKGEGWTKINGKDVTSLQVGDIVRAGGHTAVVLSVDNGICTFVECWGSSKYGCEINIGKFNNSCQTLSQIKSRYSLEYVFRYDK